MQLLIKLKLLPFNNSYVFINCGCGHKLLTLLFAYSSAKMAEPYYTDKLKLVLYGDSGSGKTQLILSSEAIQRHYRPTGVPQPTVGVNFWFSNIKQPRADLVIWDTSGNKMFMDITSLYCRGCTGLIAVFDVTNDESFVNVQNTWLPLIRKYDDGLKQVILVGTKCDLDNAKRVVSKERALIVADEEQLRYFEVSGITGYNVDHMFTELTNDIIKMNENKAKMRRR